MGFSVVVLESDPTIAQSLVRKLSPHFQPVHITNSADELRERIARTRPEAVVINLEQSPLSDVRNLHQSFPSLPIVCVHRIPDEELWVAALEAGASDVCRADDSQNVFDSVLQSVAALKSLAA